MHILIIILLGIAALIAILLILALFAGKSYTVSRNIVIQKSKKQVFDYVKLIRNQDYYSKWVMVDPDKKKEFRGIDGTVGFVYAWNGNKRAGEGEQEIMSITEAELIQTEIRFVRPFAGIAQANMATISLADNQTLVKWSFNSKMKYPMNAMLLFMNMDKMLGKDMEISLQNLKKILEG